MNKASFHKLKHSEGKLKLCRVKQSKWSAPIVALGTKVE